MILVDGDIVAFRCAASCEPSKRKAEMQNDPELAIITEPEYVAVARMENMLDNIMKECGLTAYQMFLSGKENFRKKIYPEYKAHRKKVEPPTWLQQCREHLVTRWKAEVCDGYEADDGIGIAHNDRSIVASIDKDLLQLPGRHFNFVKNEHIYVELEFAERKVWELMLIGDPADGIKGVKGIGAVNAERILDQGTPSEWREVVRHLYNDDARFLLNERLIRVLRSLEEWEEVQKLNENSFRESKGEESTEEGSGFNFDHVPHTNS